MYHDLPLYDSTYTQGEYKTAFLDIDDTLFSWSTGKLQLDRFSDVFSTLKAGDQVCLVTARTMASFETHLRQALKACLQIGDYNITVSDFNNGDWLKKEQVDALTMTQVTAALDAVSFNWKQALIKNIMSYDNFWCMTV